MSAPRIGLPVTVADPEARYRSYAAAITLAGGVVVFLPPGATNPVAGLLLLGGGDVDPSRFGSDRHPRCGVADAPRDAWELALLQRFQADRRPILGVCRGLQMLNVARGGTLVQHLPDLGHEHQLSDGGQHPITVARESRLAGILACTELPVNSRHHQAIGGLGTGLRPVAWARDGVIEAVEDPDRPEILAVQWHPEDLASDLPAHQALFQALVEAART